MSDVALITVQPRIVSTGVPTTFRLAGGGGRKGYYYGANHYRAGIASLPRFRAELGFDEQGWNGGVVPTTGSIVWAPYTKTSLAELAAYFWPGAAITIETGDEDIGAFTTLLTGKVADAAVQDHHLVITVGDLGASLDKPLVTARFAGTGAAEGGGEATGRIKRRTWGRAFNIEGRILDKANNIYEFGDPAFPWQSFETLRDMGRDAAPAPTVVAWAGSVAATLTALIASSPVQGSGVVAPSIACAKWWTQPSGPLTADVKGEIGSGYVETAASIAERILSAISGPTITNVSTANGWRGGVAGIHVDENETIAQALDRLMMGVSLLWIFNPAGTITLREITFTSPVTSLTSDNVERLRTFPPVKTRRLGYQKSHRLHTDGEIAIILNIVDLGAYAGAATYRQNNIVQNQGSSWIYINAAPASGNAPPTLPTTSNSWWRLWVQPGGPTIDLTADAEAFTYLDQVASPSSQTITLTANLTNTNETVNWSTSPSVTLGGSGNTRTLTNANFGSNAQVVVTATGATTGASAKIIVVRADRSTADADATQSDNMVKNSGLATAANWSLTGIATHVTAGSNAWPSPGAVQITGAGSGLAYANAGVAIPCSHKRLNVSAAFACSTTTAAGKLGVRCDKADGTVVDFKELTLTSPTSDGSWQRLGGWVDLHADTAKVAFYWDKTTGAGQTVKMTGLRAAPTERASDETRILRPAASQVIQFDYTGATSSQLPKILTNKMEAGGSDVTPSTSFSYSADACTVDTTGCLTGQVRLTDVDAANAAITVTATYNGIPRVGTIPIQRVLGDAPTGGGGGSGATGFSVDVAATITDTTYDGSPQPLFTPAPQMRSNGSGQIRMVLNAEYGAASNQTAQLDAKAQVSTDGSTWSDAGLSASGTSATGGYWVDSNGNGMVDFGEDVPGTSGTISANSMITGLTASTDYYVRWIGKKSGTSSSIGVSGTASGAQS